MSEIDKRTLPKDPEVIKQISETKSEDSRQLIEEKIKDCELTQAEPKLAVPTHRKKQHIGFEEYQSLIKQGKTVNEIIQTTSKHLVYFYNALLKGKINISKEEFVKLYEEGKSLNEISELKEIPREHMTFLREFYGIKRKGATYIKRVSNEKPLSQDAKDVIIGSMLGDGHITKWGYFTEKHSEKQVEYLEWKGEALKEILNENSYTIYSTNDKRSGTQIEAFCLRTTTHDFLYETRSKFYKEIDGEMRKTVPFDIKDLLTEKILAIWFMDDGNTDWIYRSGIKEYPNAKPQCKLCSESFSLEENLLLSKSLEERYGLISNIRFKDTLLHKLPYLRFDCDSSIKLMKIIKQFVTKDLLYKVDEQEYLKHQKNYVDKNVAKKDFIARHNIDITKIVKNEK